MFGHDNDKDNDSNQAADTAAPADDNTSNDTWQHPGTPLNDDSNNSGVAAGTPADDDKPGAPEPEHAEPDNVSPSVLPDLNGSPETVSAPATHSADDLIDLKQEALTKLSPLVGHLDQTPDEKFRTLMMMIQASDDQALVKEAYETALKIDDEKERAQALLDIVNEINYFTQNPSK